MKNECQDIKTALKHPITYKLLLIFYFGSMYGISVASNYKTYAEKYYTDDHFLSTAGSIGNIFNGLSRVVFGFLMDKISFRKSVAIVIIL